MQPHLHTWQASHCEPQHLSTTQPLTQSNSLVPPMDVLPLSPDQAVITKSSLARLLVILEVDYENVADSPGLGGIGKGMAQAFAKAGYSVGESDVGPIVPERWLNTVTPSRDCSQCF